MVVWDKLRRCDFSQGRIKTCVNRELPLILLTIKIVLLKRIKLDIFYLIQDKFKEDPVVLVTSEHLRTGKEYDAALIWTEDATKDSFKVCLREMQNFDGKHEDIDVVRV